MTVLLYFDYLFEHNRLLSKTYIYFLL